MAQNRGKGNNAQGGQGSRLGPNPPGSRGQSPYGKSLGWPVCWSETLNQTHWARKKRPAPAWEFLG